MHTRVIEVRNRSALATDITRHAIEFCDGLGDGLLNVFVPHATAGVTLMETGSGSESDLEDTIERLLPIDDIYRHRHGSVGHGRDHVVPAFISPSIVIPVISGEPELGTWQSVVLVDTNGDNPHRMVRFSFVSG